MKDKALVYGKYFKTFFNYKNLLIYKVEKKKTHIELGQELGIYTISEEAGSGLPLFKSRGFIIREELIRLIREKNKQFGYQEVWTPHILNLKLWKRSGHLKMYKDRMFIIKVMDEIRDLNPTIALLPVSGTYVMTREEAVQALKDIKPKIAIPMHYGTIVGSEEDAIYFKNNAPKEVEIHVLKPYE